MKVSVLFPLLLLLLLLSLPIIAQENYRQSSSTAETRQDWQREQQQTHTAFAEGLSTAGNSASLPGNKDNQVLYGTSIAMNSGNIGYFTHAECG
jgi:hypothetical protein